MILLKLPPSTCKLKKTFDTQCSLKLGYFSGLKIARVKKGPNPPRSHFTYLFKHVIRELQQSQSQRWANEKLSIYT